MDRSLHGVVAAGRNDLDIGCGTGDPIGRHLLSSGFDLTGLDTSSALIEAAKSSLPGATWQIGDMRHLALGRSFVRRRDPRR